MIQGMTPAPIDIRTAFVISDTHFNHDNIKRLCRRPRGHDEEMVACWREAIGPDDVILHLGDLCFGTDVYEEDINPLLTGRKYLMLGNHDNAKREFYERCGFTLVEPFETWYRGNGRSCRVTFDHYPIDERSDEWPLADNHIHIHGHIHNNGYGAPPEYPVVPYRRNQCNVSVEMTKYRPVALWRLLKGVTE